jgi:hypothetical protein
MATKKPRHPWERRKCEPDAAYAHFLLYRNLGLARSIGKAYSAYKATSEVYAIAIGEEAAKGGKRRRAPGNWWGEAATHEWEGRAVAWDVAMLASTGRKAIAAFCALLEQASVRCLAAVVNGEIAPNDWTKLIETIHALGSLIPSDLIRDAALHGEGGREDGRGRGDQRPRHGAV